MALTKYACACVSVWAETVQFNREIIKTANKSNQKYELN